MRHFPAAARQRLVVAVTAAALGAGVLTPAISAWADIKHLRHQHALAQHSVRHAQSNLDESSRQTRTAYAALSRSRSHLRSARHDLGVARTHVRAARSRLVVIRRQLGRAKARLARVEADLAREQQAATSQHDQLVHTVTSFYEDGDPQLVGMLSLLGSATATEVSAKQANNSLVLDSQNRILSGLKASQVLLKVQAQARIRARDQVARKKDQARAKLLAKREYEQQALDAKVRIERSVRQRRHAWALARRARAHDRAVLARSRRLDAHIQRLIQAAIAREQRSGAGYRGSTSGLLMRPVNGPITSGYGYRINPVMGYWGLHDGDDFAAACGTPIWAAGNGTVMSEYYSSIWGHRLFINLGMINGKNVTVIYNHLSAYRSFVGEHVSRGQVVGLIGTTGWSTGCHTHFTVMVNGVAVNPNPWLGI